MNERLQWFKDHIGKVVWRNEVFVMDCIDVDYHKGVIIDDKQHAIYLHDIETEFTKDGDTLRYFSTKEERDEFLKNFSEIILKTKPLLG